MSSSGSPREDQSLAAGDTQPAEGDVARGGRGLTPGPGDRASTGASRAAPGALADLVALPTIDRSYYAVGAEVAKGGMGRVVAARDRRAGRAVAVKELLLSTPEARLRFEREARITARLQHPAIIPVYEIGQWDDGEPFYAMKHVEGQSFEQVIAATATLQTRLARLPEVLAVADALAFAHSRRIIHRDLKPANILVGAFGETVVIDWGLAKDLGSGPAGGAGARDEHPGPEAWPSDAPGDATATPSPGRGPAPSDDGLTVLGSAMGTPAYMPPEQARGDAVDERADVYALGAVLYHLLAGHPPYDGAKSAAEILKLLSAGPPESLREVAPGAPADLLAIVDKAMARAPQARYAHAGELAGDLRRFQTGQLVGAHTYSAWERVARWVRRRRAVVLVSAVAIVLAVVGASVSVRGLAQERDRARRWARESEAARLDATDQVERLSLERARALLPTDPSRAHELAQAIPPSSRWRPLAELTMSVARTWGVSTVLWRGDDLSKLAGAADGSTIAWSAGQQVFVRRGDVETGFSLPAQVAALAVAPDGATLAVATVDGQVFHGPVGATPGLLDGKVDGKIRELSLDSAPGLLVAAGDDLAVWWELAVTPPRLVLPSTGPTPSPTATTAADLVVTRRYDRVDIWSRSQAQLVRSVGTYRNSWTRRAAQLMPDGIHLLVLDDQRTLWQDDIVTANRKRLGQITGNDTVVVWVGMIGPDPAVVDIQGRVHTWRDGQPWMDTYESNGKEERGSVLAVAAMGREVALGLESGEIVVVNTVDPRQQFVRVLRGHVGWVSEVLSWERSDARSLISAGGDGTLRSWALGVGEEQDRTATRPAPPIAGQGASTSSPQRVAGADPAVRSYEPTIGIPVGTAVSPDQRYFVWQRGQGGESLRLADLSSTEGGHAQLAGCNMYPVFAAASPYFACVRRFDGAVIVWDTRTWVPIDVAVTGVGQVDSLALSYDGQLVVAGIMADDGAVFALDRSTGTRGTWASPGNTWSVTFVPGTSWFATGGGGATVRLWRGASGGVAVLGGEASWIREVAAGKQRVYAADAAGTIGIWDVQRGRRARLRIDRGSTGEVDQLVVAPDEATLLARYDNRRLVVWDVESRASLPLPDDLIGGDLAADRRSFTATRPDGSTERIAMPERDLQHVPAQAPSAEDLEWRPFDLEWTPATPAKGVQHIVEVAAAKPDAADAQRAAGAALFRAGRLDEAASYFRRAIALGDSRAAWDLVTLETGSAAPGERERLLAAAAQRLAVRFPWDSWKVFGEHARGPLAYLVASPAASRAQKAAVLRTWMRAAQDDADRLDDLAYFALRAGTLDVARDIAVRLARTSDADHLATAAEVYHALGDDARAVALGERAMTLAPDREGLRTRMRRFRAADAEPSVRVHWMVPPVIGPPVAPRLVPPDEAQP